jgi:hypothetical protein
MRITYSTKLEKTNKDAIIKLSNDTKIPQSKLMDEAIEDLVKKYSEFKFPNKKKGS